MDKAWLILSLQSGDLSDLFAHVEPPVLGNEQ
jgi:hypothetical protein